MNEYLQGDMADLNQKSFRLPEPPHKLMGWIWCVVITLWLITASIDTYNKTGVEKFVCRLASPSSSMTAQHSR